MKMVSMCLLGVPCAYDGEPKTNPKVVEMARKQIVIAVCPEVWGGEKTPRTPREIIAGTGKDVLERKCPVRGKDGKDDATENFIRGAEIIAQMAGAIGVTEFIGRRRSPSCGCGSIHDGTFTGNTREGDGVTAARLRAMGVKITSEEEL